MGVSSMECKACYEIVRKLIPIHETLDSNGELIVNAQHQLCKNCYKIFMNQEIEPLTCWDCRVIVPRVQILLTILERLQRYQDRIVPPFLLLCVKKVLRFLLQVFVDFDFLSRSLGAVRQITFLVIDEKNSQELLGISLNIEEQNQLLFCGRYFNLLSVGYINLFDN